MAFKQLGLAALSSLFLATSASALSIIDFDALDAGSLQTVPLPSFSEDGFTFSLGFTDLSGTNFRDTVGPAIFDTTNPVNGDADLVPGSQGENGVSGNILIHQERGSNVPDDIQNGAADIILTLTSGSAFKFLGGSAVDDGVFTFFTIVGGIETLAGQVNLANDNQTGQFSLAALSSPVLRIGDSIRINYSGSGGVDSLVLAAVPLPAALPLMGAGFAALSFVGWRRKKRKTA